MHSVVHLLLGTDDVRAVAALCDGAIRELAVVCLHHTLGAVVLLMVFAGLAGAAAVNHAPNASTVADLVVLHSLADLCDNTDNLHKQHDSKVSLEKQPVMGTAMPLCRANAASCLPVPKLGYQTGDPQRPYDVYSS